MPIEPPKKHTIVTSKSICKVLVNIYNIKFIKYKIKLTTFIINKYDSTLPSSILSP